MSIWRNCLLPWLALLLPVSALAAPQRIVSLTPHITEMLYAIGAGSQVVATDQASSQDVLRQVLHYLEQSGFRVRGSFSHPLPP